VGGIGHEPLLAVEGGLEPAEEVVEGIGQLLQLVVGTGQGEALVEVLPREPPGGGGHLVQRLEHPPGEQPAQTHRGQGGDAESLEGPEEEVVQGVLTDVVAEVPDDVRHRLPVRGDRLGDLQRASGHEGPERGPLHAHHRAGRGDELDPEPAARGGEAAPHEDVVDAEEDGAGQEEQTAVGQGEP
jgi:hypothetical protein